MGHLRTAWALARFACRAVPDGWYLRAPFLPFPPRKYLSWRLQTAYGVGRPSWDVVLRDVWQFGAWLAELDELE